MSYSYIISGILPNDDTSTQRLRAAALEAAERSAAHRPDARIEIVDQAQQAANTVLLLIDGLALGVGPHDVVIQGHANKGHVPTRGCVVDHITIIISAKRTKPVEQETVTEYLAETPMEQDQARPPDTQPVHHHTPEESGEVN